jgi:hypothetical protein
MSFLEANQAQDLMVATVLKVDEASKLLHFYFSLIYLVLSATLVALGILE